MRSNEFTSLSSRILHFLNPGGVREFELFVSVSLGNIFGDYLKLQEGGVIFPRLELGYYSSLKGLG